MTLRDELFRIREANGVLTPANVLKAARPKKAPLHNRFEWDDAIAGEAYRLEQAHELIMSVQITYRNDPKRGPQSIRQWHAIRGEKGWTYEPAEEIADDPFLTRLLLSNMEHEWRAMRARYEHFKEFWSLVRQDLDKAG